MFNYYLKVSYGSLDVDLPIQPVLNTTNFTISNPRSCQGVLDTTLCDKLCQ